MSSKHTQSRIENSLRNVTFIGIGQIITIVFGFITRTVFVKTLGTDYLGINGLFSNIIMLLSLTELGIGTAIIFNLYKPIAENDYKHICSLMKFYKQVYRIIGLVILFIGLLLLPFLPFLIKNPPTFINIYVIFIIYLFQSVSSYLFFAYKRALIQANQKAYIIDSIGCFFTIGSNIVQIITLVFIRNFYLYCSIIVISNIIQNIVTSRKCDKMFSYLKEYNDNNLSSGEKKTIFKSCYAISLYKINGLVVNAGNNIILAKFISLAIVGLYSNYVMILSGIRTMINIIFTAITASLGNLHAKESIEKQLDVFWLLNFISFSVFSIVTCGYFICANTFVSVWLSDEFQLSQVFVLLMSIDLYMYGIQRSTSVFRNSMGLFQQAKYRPVFGAIINIVLSLFLVTKTSLGINGVMLGTIIANLLTFFWFDPMVIFKHGFHSPVRIYYFKNILYVAVAGLAYFVSYIMFSMLNLQGLMLFIVGGIISVIVSITFICIFFGRTKEFSAFIKLIKKLIQKNIKIFGVKVLKK